MKFIHFIHRRSCDTRNSIPTICVLFSTAIITSDYSFFCHHNKKFDILTIRLLSFITLIYRKRIIFLQNPLLVIRISRITNNPYFIEMSSCMVYISQCTHHQTDFIIIMHEYRRSLGKVITNDQKVSYCYFRYW